MGTIQVIAASLALAFLAESMVEYLFGSLVDHVPALDKFRWTLMYVSAGVGVGLAFFYELDIIRLITAEDITPVGMILSGLMIGRGANFVHQFVASYLPKSS